MDRGSCLDDKFVSTNHTQNITKINHCLDRIPGIYTNKEQLEKNIEDFNCVISDYSEDTILLGPHLGDIFNKLMTMISKAEIPLKHAAFRHLAIAVKVCSYKSAVRHLPHSVSDLLPALTLLENQESESGIVESRYCLLLWLSIVVKIPFNFDLLDGTLQLDQPRIAERIWMQIEKSISSDDICSKGAAQLAIQFLTRPGSDEFLNIFMRSAKDKIKSDSKNVVSWKLPSLLSALVGVFQYGKREDFTHYADEFFEVVNDPDCEICCHNETIIRKMAVKLIQRVGLVFLQPRSAKWRYRQNAYKWHQNGFNGNSEETKEEEEEYNIRPEIQDIIVLLLGFLRDQKRVVRWSAAKGIGRICERLPLPLVNEIISEVFQLFGANESHVCWHGGCLAMAEIGRRGLMMPHHLQSVVDVMDSALVFEERMGTYSLGTEVRDSACYVIWSLVRIFRTDVLIAHIRHILGLLAVVFLFDREIFVRRAASAAFQELIGREGASSLVDIDILTTCDYFAVNSKENCYGKLCLFVGQFDHYRDYMVSHLFAHKIFHWDVKIRELAAKSLGLLVVYDHHSILEGLGRILLSQSAHLSSSVSLRHGTLLSLAEITEGCWKVLEEKSEFESFFGPELLFCSQNLLNELFERKIVYSPYEINTDVAVCVFINKYSRFLLFPSQILPKVFEFLHQSLRHEDDHIRSSSSEALESVYSSYYGRHILTAPPGDDLVEQYLRDVGDTSSLRIRIGGILGLRSLSPLLVADHFPNIVATLLSAVEITLETQDWAESRAEALMALKKTLLLDSTRERLSEVWTGVMDHLKSSFNDYTLNNHGNIGTITRNAAIKTMTALVVRNIGTVGDDLLWDSVGLLAWQCVEPHRYTALLAFRSLGDVLGEIKLWRPRFWGEFGDRIGNVEFGEDAEFSDVFDFIFSLMDIARVRPHVLYGLVQSTGNSADKLPRERLVHYLEEGGDVLAVFWGFIAIAQNHVRNLKIIIPLYNTVEFLLVSDVLACVEESERAELFSGMFTHLRDSIRGCQNTKKLTVVAKIFRALLISEPGDLFETVLKNLLVLLGHKYAVVRHETAQLLYEALLVCGDVVGEKCDSVVNLLTVTCWRESFESARNARNEICDLLSIQRPRKI